MKQMNQQCPLSTMFSETDYLLRLVEHSLKDLTAMLFLHSPAYIAFEVRVLIQRGLAQNILQ